MKDEFMDNIEEIEIKEEADEKKESYLPTEPDIESETIIMDKFDRKLVDELHSENADNLEKRIYVYTKDQVGLEKKWDYLVILALLWCMLQTSTIILICRSGSSIWRNSAIQSFAIYTARSTNQ